MTMHRRRLLQFAGVGFATLALSGTTWSQTFPSRPVTLIVPFSAGGSNDVTSRALAKATEKYLGQPIVIDNVTGAGGIIGATRAAEAKPDGYTLVTTVMSVLLAPYLVKTSYDSTTD